MKLRYITSYREGLLLTEKAALGVAFVILLLTLAIGHPALVFSFTVALLYAAIGGFALLMQEWQLVDRYRLQSMNEQKEDDMETLIVQSRLQKLKQDVLTLPRKVQDIHAAIVNKDRELRHMRSERLSAVVTQHVDPKSFFKRERKVRQLLQDIKDLRSKERSYRAQLDQEKTDLRLAMRFQHAAEGGDMNAARQVTNILKKYA